MSDRQRAEMAEAKLAAIRALMGQYYDALELEPHILDILNSQEFGGYWQGDVTALEPHDYPADGHVKVQGGLEIPVHRVRIDHKEP